MLKRGGWWGSWELDCQCWKPKADRDESLVWRLSRRLATECLFSETGTRIGQTGFITSGIIDFSPLEAGMADSIKSPSKDSSKPLSSTNLHDNDIGLSQNVTFSVSACGNYLLVMTRSMIYIYHLKCKRHGENVDIEFMCNLHCPEDVCTATIDTSGPKFVVAALLRGRMGMVCEVEKASAYTMTQAPAVFLKRQLTYERLSTASTLNEVVTASAKHVYGIPTQYDPAGQPDGVLLRETAKKYYHNICSEDDSPHSVSIYPSHQCVAFGCSSGFELHWVDKDTKKSCRKLVPTSRPSETLRLLPHYCEISAGIASKTDHCATGKSLYSTPQSPSSNRKILNIKCKGLPINDGLHLLFVDAYTGFLCMGSDAPLGSAESLTRALICIPPLAVDEKHGSTPDIFTAGSDLRWGLRIVAAYRSSIVLYSVPADVLKIVQRERERQGDGVIADSDLARDTFLANNSGTQSQNGDWTFLLDNSCQTTSMMWPFTICGKQIGQMVDITNLALQTSHGSVRVWGFDSTGKARIFDIDTFTSPTIAAEDVALKSVKLDSDGSVASAKLMNRVEVGLLS
ncbi:hypothetical protein Plec18167_002932 [Paecilomyces lecythidis]|uniref:Uncharacterized protein n=1 Tax=Paecilomyces lecythidis TaxID=3004212 RepID=A0ABR3Y2M5_9EURO